MMRMGQPGSSRDSPTCPDQIQMASQTLRAYPDGDTDIGASIFGSNSRFRNHGVFRMVASATTTFHSLDGGDGRSTENKLRIMARLMEETKPARTLEIGLGVGASALLFASYHRDAGHQSQTHLAIDPYQTSPTAFNSAALRALEGAGLASFVSHRSNFSSLELPKLVGEGASFDLIYIDGSHLFEDVFVDAYFSAHLLSGGGIMLFDDSASAQVLKVVRFIRANMRGTLAELDLSTYREGSRFRYWVARAISRVQLTAFRRISSAKERDWREWTAPCGAFERECLR
jgi:predicted O-methyltransferase YrrM